jgi:hypothetical protein
VTKIDDADRNDYPATTIEVLRGNQQAAAILATRLRIQQSAIKVVPAMGATADLRVIVGRSQQ